MKKILLFLALGSHFGFGAAVQFDPVTGALTSPIATNFYSANPPPSAGGVTSFNTRSGAVTLTAADVNAVGPLTLNITGNASGSAGSVALSGVTGMDSTVKTAAAVPVNTSSGLATSFGASALTLPFLLGPATKNYVFIGDSITVGPSGLTQNASQGFPAVVQYMGAGSSTNALCYNLGMRAEKTSDILGQWSGTGAVTPTLTTTNGSVTATVSSATGISNGMCIGSANTPPNTLLTISGTTLTLSQKATATGSVPCSIATAPLDLAFSDAYCGGAANKWAGFSGTAAQLSYGISAIPTYAIFMVGTNDFAENGGIATTLTATTVSGSPNLTVTSGSGTYTGLVYGLVLSGTGIPTTPLPPYIISGQGTANLVMSANATASGSVTVTVHYPTTSLASYTSSLTSLVTTAHAAGDTTANGGGVIVCTILPAGGSGQSTTTSEVFRQEYNAVIAAKTAGNDFTFDTASVFPSFGSIVGSPYYSSDWLHPSVLGDAVQGRFMNLQFFLQVYTSQLAWNPFAPTSLPDQWLSTNIPRLNQAAVFSPYKECLQVTANITTSSTSATVAANSGVLAGMYVYASDAFGNNAYPPLTFVSSVSGTTLTMSNASKITNSSANLFLSLNQFPDSTVFKNDVYIGPSLDTAAGVFANLRFTTQGDNYSNGLIWQDVNGTSQWNLYAPTSGTGTMNIGKPSVANLALGSTGSVTLTGTNVSMGSAPLTVGSIASTNFSLSSSGVGVAKSFTLSGVNSAVVPLVVKSADSGSYALEEFDDHSSAAKLQIGYLEGSFFGNAGTNGILIGVDLNIKKPGNNGALLDSFSATDGTFTSASTKIVLSGTATPASSSAAGVPGQIQWDTNFVYVCTGTNTWKRSAISTW